MAHHKAVIVYILDAISGLTFLAGLVTAQYVFMTLGGIASLVAILNHGYDFIKKIKNKKDGAS